MSSLSVQYPSSNDVEDAPQIVPLHLPDPIMGGPLGADPGEKRGPASDADSFELNYERISQSRFNSMPTCSVASRPSLRWAAKGDPALTRPVRVGVGKLRSGRKKTCGAVEPKKRKRGERKIDT